MIRSTFIAAGLALAAVLPAVPAQATSLTRTFVSSAGMDTNPCTITQPCATFAHAYTLTLANGIIAALDPGKYGPLTIMGPVTVNGNGWAAVTGPASGNAITINANSSDKVSLIGLEIDGAGAANNGIQFNSGGSLSVRDSVIRNFSGTGIIVQPSAGEFVALAVTDSDISEHGGNGITIAPRGTAGVTGVLDRVSLNHNGFAGLQVDLTTNNGQAGVAVTVTDSVASNNGTTDNGAGFLASSSGGILAEILLVRCTAVHNPSNGIVAFGNSALVLVSASAVYRNDSGWLASSGGVIYSFGNNVVVDNDFNQDPKTNLTME